MTSALHNLLYNTVPYIALVPNIAITMRLCYESKVTRAMSPMYCQHANIGTRESVIVSVLYRCWLTHAHAFWEIFRYNGRYHFLQSNF